MAQLNNQNNSSQLHTASDTAKHCRIAVITGASSGLGQEYCRYLDQKEQLEELWIIARRQERLVELDDTLSTHCRIFALDLSQETSFTELERQLAAHAPDIRFLINAAGFGKQGNYAEHPTLGTGHHGSVKL